MSRTDPYFKQLRDGLSNLKVKKLLDMAKIKHSNNFTKNVQLLSNAIQLQQQKQGLGGLISNENLTDERYLTALLRNDLMNVAVLNPVQILANHKIPFPEGGAGTTLIEHVAPEKRQKVADMINKTQNMELIMNNNTEK